MQRHIIHQQKINLQVSRMEEAHGYQNLVSNWMQKELPGRMEAIFAELFPSDSIIRIDSLQVDLGNIDPGNFEQDFKDQFMEVFRSALSSKKENLSEANHEEELSNARSLLNTLIFFLEKGYLPWYRSAKSIADLEDEVLKNLSDTEYQYLFEWIRYHYQDNAVILQRLIMQFPDRFLEKLLSEIGHEQQDTWKDIYNDLVTASAIFIKDNRSVRTEIWKFTFHVLLNNSKEESASRVEIWAFQVLKLLANRFLPGNGITALMEIKAKKKLKTAAVQHAFKDLAGVLDSRGHYYPDKPAKGKHEVQKANVNQRNFDTERYKIKNHVSTDEDTFYIKGSGVVILHFFLKPFFEDLKLIRNGKFVTDTAHQRAVILLHYLATGEVEVAEFDLALQKILCGYPLNETLPASIVLTKKERAESEKMLKAVTDYWAPLKNTSADGLRDTFLQREGKLVKKENGWLLTVEQKTVDVLLGKIPWGFSTIRLPWMEQILNVDWY